MKDQDSLLIINPLNSILQVRGLRIHTPTPTEFSGTENREPRTCKIALNWYYKFSKSIVISVFTLSYYYYFLHNLYGDCAKHSTSDPSLPTSRTDLVHMCPTPSLRGLNNLSN